MVQTQLDNYQTQIIMNYGMETQFKDMRIHPQYPLIHLFKLFEVGPFPTKLCRFLWYLLHGYYIGIEVYVGFLLKNLRDLGQFRYFLNSSRFLLWFDTMDAWKARLEIELKEDLKKPSLEDWRLLMLTTSWCFIGLISLLIATMWPSRLIISIRHIISPFTISH